MLSMLLWLEIDRNYNDFGVMMLLLRSEALVECDFHAWTDMI